MTGRALLLRCPDCGSGGVFDSRMRMRHRCRNCGLRFEQIEGTWIGAVGLNTIVTFTVLFVVLLGGLLLSWPGRPGWAVIASVVTTAALLPVIFFPWSKTLWLVIELAMRPPEESGRSR